MYEIFQQPGGRWACACRIQDGTERWEVPSEDSAVASLVNAARIYNGVRITRADIATHRLAPAPDTRVSAGPDVVVPAFAIPDLPPGPDTTISSLARGLFASGDLQHARLLADALRDAGRDREARTVDYHLAHLSCRLTDAMTVAGVAATRGADNRRYQSWVQFCRAVLVEVWWDLYRPDGAVAIANGRLGEVLAWNRVRRDAVAAVESLADDDRGPQ